MPTNIRIVKIIVYLSEEKKIDNFKSWVFIKYQWIVKISFSLLNWFKDLKQAMFLMI